MLFRLIAVGGDKSEGSFKGSLVFPLIFRFLAQEDILTALLSIDACYQGRAYKFSSFGKCSAVSNLQIVETNIISHENIY